MSKDALNQRISQNHGNSYPFPTEKQQTDEPIDGDLENEPLPEVIQPTH